MIFVTPAPIVAPWAEHTLEQFRIQQQLLAKNITVKTTKVLVGRDDKTITIGCVYSGAVEEIAAENLVLVSTRMPQDQLMVELMARQDEWAASGIESIKLIGDALNPSLIAAAIYSGHEYAEIALGNDAVDREDIMPSHIRG